MAFKMESLERALMMGYDTVEQAIIGMYRRGYKIEDIRKELRISSLRVYQTLEKYGVPKRAPTRKRQKERLIERLLTGSFYGDKERVIRALDSGSIYAVRVHFGCGYDKARRFVREWRELSEAERERILMEVLDDDGAPEESQAMD